MRGDLVVVNVQGDYGKPRPALIIQSDAFAKTDSVSVLLVTSDLQDIPMLRLPIEPDEHNNLKKPSQIMIDKIYTLRRAKITQPFGRIDPDTQLQVDRLLLVFLGLA